jgi:predicted transcriptional regulator
VSTRPSKSKRISVPLSPSELEILRKIAEEGDRSISWVAAQAIRFYLAETKKGSATAAEFGAAAEGR